MSVKRPMWWTNTLLWIILLSAGACLGMLPPRGFLPTDNLTVPGPDPPMADRRPHKIVTKGEGRVEAREDPYFWLRDDDRKDRDVLAYLEAENEYLKNVMSDTESLQKELFSEMREREQEADPSVPERHGEYFNYTKTVQGKQYKAHCRRKVPKDMGLPSELDVMDESIPEEVLFDENNEAMPHSFFAVEGFSVSPDGKLMMYGVDTTGSENYTMHVKEISTGNYVLEKPITSTSGDMIFGADSKTVFYVTRNEQNLPEKLWRHKIGTSPEMDECVYREQDGEVFTMRLLRSRDGEFLFLSTRAITFENYHVLDAQNPDGEWQPLYEREDNSGYTPEHRDGYFYFRMQDDSTPNGELVVAPISDLENKKVLIPHRDDAQILSFSLSQNFLTMFGMENATPTVTVYELPKNGSAPESLGRGKKIEFDEPTFVVESGGQGNFESDILRLSYDSLTTPSTIIDYNMVTGNRSVKKVTPVWGEFNSSDYENVRLWATAKDSTKIPISLVYRKDAVKLDGTDPLQLHVYGAYGFSRPPSFDNRHLSLLDRGFVYAIAHVRGGQEIGRYWWEDGKSLNKKNTFTDTIACAEELIRQNYTSPEKLSLFGGSAGGTTIAAAINMRPDLFHTVIMQVPYVDVLTSLLDETVPLTVSDRKDLGSPNNWEYYDYIKGYSPVDNVRAQDYPHIMVTAGLNDWRVPYWEVAKYTAKLRSLKTDDNLLIMKTEMEAGHRTKSGRYDKFEDYALNYAFLLKSLGMVDSFGR